MNKFAIVALLMVGCSGTAGPTGLTGPQGPAGEAGVVTSTITTPVSAGSTCPNGGVEVQTGYMVNHVFTQTSPNAYVCNGKNGSPGSQGSTGAQGTPGINGRNGEAGATGATGAQGATGPAGRNGEAGATGATGAQGATGPAGANGQTGATGETGPQGDVGATGQTGSAGSNGNDGFNSLIVETVVGDGSSCAYGGVEIESGLDLNRDGILEASEVTADDFVCNGAPGPQGDASVKISDASASIDAGTIYIVPFGSYCNGTNYLCGDATEECGASPVVCDTTLNKCQCTNQVSAGAMCDSTSLLCTGTGLQCVQEDTGLNGCTGTQSPDACGTNVCVSISYGTEYCSTPNAYQDGIWYQCQAGFECGFVVGNFGNAPAGFRSWCSAPVIPSGEACNPNDPAGNATCISGLTCTDIAGIFTCQ